MNADQDAVPAGEGCTDDSRVDGGCSGKGRVASEEVDHGSHAGSGISSRSPSQNPLHPEGCSERGGSEALDLAELLVDLDQEARPRELQVAAHRSKESE